MCCYIQQPALWYICWWLGFIQRFCSCVWPFDSRISWDFCKLQTHIWYGYHKDKGKHCWRCSSPLMQNSCWSIHWWVWFVPRNNQRTACWSWKAYGECSQKLSSWSCWSILSSFWNARICSSTISWWSLPVCIWRQKPDCCWYGKRLARRSRYLPQWQEDFPYLGQWGGPAPHHLHAEGRRCSWCVWKTCQWNQSSWRLS